MAFYGKRAVTGPPGRSRRASKGRPSKAPVLTVTGDFEVFIGNYRGIAEYSDDLVRIRTRTGQIRVAGSRLQVDYYTNDEMKVTGKIEEIRFENGRDEA